MKRPPSVYEDSGEDEENLSGANVVNLIHEKDITPFSIQKGWSSSFQLCI